MTNLDNESRTSDMEIYQTTLRVSRSTILSVDELKARLSNVRRPGIFEEYPPYFFGADISTNKTDTYFTSMANSSLKNYAADGEAGIAFQNSHRHNELPFGKSLSGRFVGGADARTSFDFYTIPDLNLNGVNTTELIKGIDSEIIADVSIGFYGGWYRCSICNEDMFDWSQGWDEMCPHIPGVEYAIKDKQGNEVSRSIAIAFVEDANVSEVSAVFDGACPGAAIRKAVIAVDAGWMKPEIANMLEQRYRIKFSGAHKKYGGLALPEREMRMGVTDRDLLDLASGGPNMADEVAPVGEGESKPNAETQAVADTAENLEHTPLAEVNPDVEREVDPPLSVETDEDRAAKKLVTVSERSTTEVLAEELRAAGINPGVDPRKTLEKMRSEFVRMQPLAKDGTLYRENMIKEAKEEGIRALGDDFDPAVYDQLLANATIDSIIKLRDDFRSTAARTNPPGRHTEEAKDPLAAALKNAPVRKVVTPRRLASFANG